MDPLTLTVVALMVVAATLLLVIIAYAWAHPLQAQEPQQTAAGDGEAALSIYCPQCWQEFRRHHPSWDPPRDLPGLPVTCARHRLFEARGLTEELVPAVDGPNDEYAEEVERGWWS